MPIPEQVAHWNKAGLNRVARHIAPWLPGLGLIVHRGRRSGREYRTPVEVFQARDGFIVALTYGVDTDWLRNIQPAGGGLLPHPRLDLPGQRAPGVPRRGARGRRGGTAHAAAARRGGLRAPHGGLALHQLILPGVVDQQAVVAEAHARRGTVGLEAAVVHEVAYFYPAGDRGEVRRNPCR